MLNYQLTFMAENHISQASNLVTNVGTPQVKCPLKEQTSSLWPEPTPVAPYCGFLRHEPTSSALATVSLGFPETK